MSRAENLVQSQEASDRTAGADTAEMLLAGRFASLAWVGGTAVAQMPTPEWFAFPPSDVETAAAAAPAQTTLAGVAVLLGWAVETAPGHHLGAAVGGVGRPAGGRRLLSPAVQTAATGTV